MTSDLLQRIETEGAAINLASRARFQLTGTDRVRYLNGQVTNDVRQTDARRALYAVVTDVKAHIVADIFIHVSADGSALLIDAEGELRDMLAARLERYIIADDVVLDDVTEAWQQWHFIGPAAEALRNETGAIECRRLGEHGVDLWLPTGAVAPTFTAPELTAADFETLRVLRGIPRCPNELNGEAFPAEAHLEESAISFTKGCYIGQEIISRIRTTGKMPRTLVRWMAEPGEAVRPGMTLATPGNPDKTIGIITSAAVQPVTSLAVGLAYVRQGAVEPDSRLLARGEPPTLAATVKLSGPAK